jgi:glucokinase
VIEEITLRVGPGSVQAAVKLALGPRSFLGEARPQEEQADELHLAAAATVAALQQCLLSSLGRESQPRLELVDVERLSTGAGRPVVKTTIKLSAPGCQQLLVGTALVRNDPLSTAVAATLDASSRLLGRLLSPSAPSPRVEPERRLAKVTEEPSFRPPAEPHSRSGEPAGGGRPALDLLPAGAALQALSLGLELSGTSIRAALVDPQGGIFVESRRPSLASGPPEGTLAMICEAVEELSPRARKAAGHDSPPGGPCALGVTLRGHLEEGVCLSSSDLPGWREVELLRPLQQEFSLPCFLLERTRAAALAEHSYGAARDCREVVYVSLGADVEVARITAGRLAAARPEGSGTAAHMIVQADGPVCECGGRGCWKTLVCQEAMVARAVEAIRRGGRSELATAVEHRLGSITPGLICRLAQAEDLLAQTTIEETAWYIALGLTNLIALYGPEAVIFAGTLFQSGEGLFEAVKRQLHSEVSPAWVARCQLRPAKLREEAAILGAAEWARQRAAGAA